MQYVHSWRRYTLSKVRLQTRCGHVDESSLRFRGPGVRVCLSGVPLARKAKIKGRMSRTLLYCWKGTKAGSFSTLNVTVTVDSLKPDQATRTVAILYSTVLGISIHAWVTITSI